MIPTRCCSGTHEERGMVSGAPPGMEAWVAAIIFVGQKRSPKTLLIRNGWGGRKGRETGTHNHGENAMKMKNYKKRKLSRGLLSA